MAESDLLNRMDGFESRLFRLEELLGLHRSVAVPPRRPAAVPPIATSHAAAAPPSEELPELLDQEVAAPPLRTPPLRAPMPVMPYRPAPVARPIKQSGLEQTIGLKWAGWVGAVVLVIGAGLGIKFGYDQGWFAVVPPIVRLGLLALAGLGLIAVGEWVYRKVNVLSAVGLFGAGVALLFVASYSGHAYYDLYPRDTAFVFMGVCTVIGALVARRGNMVSIAVLSMIGGNLAPVLLSQGQPQLGGFLIYLLMLQVTSLTLAFWGAKPRWWTLRGLSLVTTCLWMVAVIDQPNLSLLLAMALVFAGLYQAELILSAVKSRLNPSRAGATYSMLVMAAMMIGVLYLLRDAGEMVRLAWTVGIAAVAGVTAVICMRAGGRSLAANPGSLEDHSLAGKLSMLHVLAYGYALQATALVVVAVPIAFSGIWISAAWGVLAIALAVAGGVLDLPTARYAAAAIWLLSVGGLVVWVNGSDGMHRDRLLGLSIAGFDFPQYTLMSWVLALQGQVIAKLMLWRRDRPAPANATFFGPAISMMAGGLWVEAALMGLSPLIATSSVLVYVGILVLLDLVDTELNLLLQATVLALAATAKWAFVDLLSHRILDPVRAESIVFSPHGFTSLILLATLLAIYGRAHATVQSNRYSRHLKVIIGGAVVGVIFWLGTFGIDQEFTNLRLTGNSMFDDPERAEQVALSIFWSLFALSSVAAGFARRAAGLRYAGLALFALTLLKVVAIDLGQVSTGYRILSFMGLGLLLLGTSVLYGKVSPMILAKSSARELEPPMNTDSD